LNGENGQRKESFIQQADIAQLLPIVISNPNKDNERKFEMYAEVNVDKPKINTYAKRYLDPYYIDSDM
jgi:hypothetical protein